MSIILHRDRPFTSFVSSSYSMSLCMLLLSCKNSCHTLGKLEHLASPINFTKLLILSQNLTHNYSEFFCPNVTERVPTVTNAANFVIIEAQNRYRVGAKWKLSFLLSVLLDNNECAEIENECDQNCQNTDGSYTCSCNMGYTLDANGHTCNGILK